MVAGQLPQIQPPQSENYLQSAQRAQALRMGPLEQEAATLSNQQRQMEIASEQGMMKAWVAAKGDPDKMAEIAPNYNVLPKHIMAVRGSLLDMAKNGHDGLGLEVVGHHPLHRPICS